MKHTKFPITRLNLCGLVLALAALVLSSLSANATPYRSGLINYGTNTPPYNTGDIGFFLNEGADKVTVIYDDGTTNANFNGVGTGLNVPRGSNSFNLAGHNGYQIQVFKTGSGTPSLISVNTDSNSMWANPGGLAVNANPKIGSEFGRIYVGSRGTGGYGWGAKGFHNYGIYPLNADFTTALNQGTNSYGWSFYVNSGGSGPWRMRVAPPGCGFENKVIVTDFSGANSSVLLWNSDLSGYQPLVAGVGAANRVAQLTGNDSTWDATVYGTTAQGNVAIWISEADWALIPGPIQGPNTGIGMYNLLLRFDLGAGTLPATGVVGPPNYAYTVGLEGIANLRPYVEIGKDGKIFAGFGRGNLSNPNVVVLDPAGQNFLYMGGLTPPFFSQDTSVPNTQDPWNGWLGANSQVGTYAGLRVSPDGKYFASVDLSTGITVANLANGIPDDTTIFNIPNGTYANTARGMDWDAADNFYVTSSGQLLTKAFSLGSTTTCVTSNDWTGTNGTFGVLLPPVVATLTVTQPFASQNYGSPTPGVARIAINTNFLSGPLTVQFSRAGSAIYANPSQAMYSINTNTAPFTAQNGVQILTNSVIFPSGTFTGVGNGGNFYVDVVITPTTFPVSTNTQTVILGLANPATWQFGTPSKGTIYIQNTGPQLLVLTAAASGGSMYRGYANDYAKFVITRYGDTNGPGNSVGNVNQNAFTVTNLSYYGTAVFGTDYKARAQRVDADASGKIWGNGQALPPVDGPTAIVFYPGDTAVTCMIGNPVMHTNLNAVPSNVTIVFNLTNTVTCGAGGLCTNNIPTPEGFTYNVLAATVTLTEVDNAVGPEVVLWKDEMTNANNSINYTLTFAGTNFGVGGMPAVVPNYVNNLTSLYDGGLGGTNDFSVLFGSDIATNYYYNENPNAGGGGIPVPPSPVMLFSNWPQKALKMTVNKQSSVICGVNVYPNQTFGGNYALRFNMFLSLWDYYINDPYVSGNYREYAMFGVNHYGTNCIWRPSTTMLPGTGMWPTNSDGVWFAVDSGYRGITPADYESYTPPPLPNSGNPYTTGGITGLQGHYSFSASAAEPQGYLKHPPFVSSSVNEATRTIATPGGGQPANKWVDVSVEIQNQTNVLFFMNRSQWLANTPITNGMGFGFSYTNGTIMLGYDDPDRTVSDASSFVYYSNVRVVELSPYLTLQPSLLGTNLYSLIRTQGSSLVLTAAVNYATAPITSVWFKASAATVGVQGGTTVNPYVQSNWFNANFANDSLALNNVSALQGTNFLYRASDQAGTVLSAPVALEVVLTPTNKIVVVNGTVDLGVRNAGPIAPTSYQWQTNKINLVASAHYLNSTNTIGHYTNNVTQTNINIVNAALAEGKTYACIVTHPAGTVTQFVNLTVVALIAPATSNALWGSSPTFSVTAVGGTPSYQWVRSATNITGATGSSFTITNCTTADVGNYSCTVTNHGTGIGVYMQSGALAVTAPPPAYSGSSIVGGIMQMLFSSPNNPNDSANAFELWSSGSVLGPWTNNTLAVFTTNTPPTGFMVTAPQQGDVMFYRLKHIIP